MERKFYFKGSLLIMTGVILGAFAAHALKEVLTPQQISSFQTGVRYHIFGGMFMFILGGLESKYNAFKLSGKLIFTGVLLFSISIYFLNIKGILGISQESFGFVGAITPIGGLLMIIGWGMVSSKLLKIK